MCTKSNNQGMPLELSEVPRVAIYISLCLTYVCMGLAEVSAVIITLEWNL